MSSEEQDSSNVEDSENDKECKSESFSSSSAIEDIKNKPVPVIKNLNSIELRQEIRMNTREITSKLRLYFMQRNVEKMRDDNDFKIDTYNGFKVKKRKAIAHFDLILEEYFNLRKLNRELVSDNRQLLRFKFKKWNRKKNIGSMCPPNVVIDPFRLEDQNLSPEERDIREALRINQIHDSMFKDVFEDQIKDLSTNLNKF